MEIMSIGSHLMLASSGMQQAAPFSSAWITEAGLAFGSTIVYSLVGLAMFALAYKVLGMMMPFDLRKELEEDQNTSLGIVLGSMMLGLAVIIAAAISG